MSCRSRPSSESCLCCGQATQGPFPSSTAQRHGPARIVSIHSLLGRIPGLELAMDAQCTLSTAGRSVGRGTCEAILSSWAGAAPLPTQPQPPVPARAAAKLGLVSSISYQTLTFNIEVTPSISLQLRAAAEPRRRTAAELGRAEPGPRQHFYYYIITISLLRIAALCTYHYYT
jgi:hypothetical protein